jgi:hypothetical protein
VGTHKERDVQGREDSQPMDSWSVTASPLISEWMDN